MSSHRETDTFPDELLTSADYPNWLAKKTRRGSKAAKAVGKSSRGPMQSRNWAEDKFPRTQQPQVPIVAKVKPEKQGVSIAGIRKPVVYQNWVLICDREYLLWDYLLRISSSSYLDDRDALLEGLRNAVAMGCQPPATETDISYLIQPQPNAISTYTPDAGAWRPSPDITTPLFDESLIQADGIYDPSIYEYHKLELGSPGSQSSPSDSMDQRSPGYYCDDSCYLSGF